MPAVLSSIAAFSVAAEVTTPLLQSKVLAAEFPEDFALYVSCVPSVDVITIVWFIAGFPEKAIVAVAAGRTFEIIYARKGEIKLSQFCKVNS